MDGAGRPGVARPGVARRGEAADADVLRARIDQGETGDKIPASDPAAAPLGTDAESAGAPPVEPGPELAAVHPSPVDMAADPAGRDRAGYRAQDRMVWPVIAVALVLAGIAAVAAAIGLG